MLYKGQLHIVKRNKTVEEYLVSTTRWDARVTAADVTFSAGDELSQCWIALLNGFTTFTPPEGNATLIPPCNKLIFGENTPGEFIPLQEKDISQVKSWVGQTVVEKALELSSCFAADRADKNVPPTWQSLPDETVQLGEKMIDTLEAVDPEQTTLTYELRDGPAGMVLDPVSGVFTYDAQEDGTHSFTLIAHDEGGLACTANVAINVTADLSVKLRGYRKVTAGKPVTFWAQPNGVDAKKVYYRFDMNGDGKYDIPSKGGYTRRAVVRKYVFKEEGVYFISVEAKSADGQKAKAKRRIIVNDPPNALLKIDPEVVQLGGVVTFDISASSDTRNGDTPLKVRYDIDGDGKWDLPSKNGFLSKQKTNYTYDKKGTFTVKAQVVDKDGASDTAIAQIIVSDGISGAILSGPDSTHVGDIVNFSCAVKDVKFPITNYTWSFDGDTVSDVSGTKNSVTKTFTQAGLYTVRCRMVDEKNQVGKAAKTVVVVNSASQVDAGGPYNTGVNKAITLKGQASDKDNKIIGYEWDVDGDGTTDYSDNTKMEVAHTYTRSGKYTAKFIVKTDDGKVTTDTAIVQVTNKKPVAKAPEDIISKQNHKVKMTGIGADEDGKIVLYEWDFDGDGTFDWSSKDTGYVEHAFTEYSTAVFRVHDSDGETATDTVRIIICPKGMETVKAGKFCIDAYEYPNKPKSTPRVDVTIDEARKICTSIGKRLCTSEEWEMACNDSKEKFNYPYGKKYDVDKCNTLGNPKVKNKAAAAGYFFECRNANGVFDMSGNVAEWTEGSGATVQGGSWQNGEQGSKCSAKVQLKKGRKYFYVGFRCCK